MCLRENHSLFSVCCSTGAETSSLWRDQCLVRRRVYFQKHKSGVLLLFIPYSEWPGYSCVYLPKGCFGLFQSNLPSGVKQSAIPSVVPPRPDPDLSFSPRLLITHHLRQLVPWSFSAGAALTKGKVSVLEPLCSNSQCTKWEKVHDTHSNTHTHTHTLSSIDTSRGIPKMTPTTSISLLSLPLPYYSHTDSGGSCGEWH